MFRSRKGMEMSINAVVGIVLGLAMFIAATVIFFNILNKSNATANQLDEQTQNKIIQALDSGDPVYVPISNVNVKKNSAVFGIGVKNIKSEPRNFSISVSILDPTTAPANFEPEDIQYLPGPYVIGAKESNIILVAVNMDKVTSKTAVLVKISVQEGYDENNFPNYVDYWKPKIVYITP